MNLTAQTLVRPLVALVLTSLCFSAHAGKVKFKYRTTDPGRVISKTTMALEDAPGHELTQSLTIRNYNVSAPGYEVKETWVYEQTDLVAGTGHGKYPNVDVLKNGDKAFFLCEGPSKTVTKDDKSWETTWEGKCRFTGGTGTLKNIKGSLTYKGKATPDQPYFEEGEYDVEF